MKGTGEVFYKGKKINEICSPLWGPNVIKYSLLYDPPLSSSSVYKLDDNAHLYKAKQ